MSLIRCGGPSAVRTRTAASCCGTRPSRHVSSGNVVITGIDQIRYWRRRSFLIWINGCPEKSPPTFGLGNRCSIVFAVAVVDPQERDPKLTEEPEDCGGAQQILPSR